jgi:hypothetical protein
MGIKIQNIAYVRFHAPDLDQMETFLTEFGMVRADRTGDALYMRGLDGDAFLHVTHKGEPRLGTVLPDSTQESTRQQVGSTARNVLFLTTRKPLL